MTAADVLILVGKLNLAAAAAIVLVFALRPIARPRVGARLTYALWLLPIIAALATLVPARRTVVQLETAAPADFPLPPVADMVESLAPISAAQAATALDPLLIVLALWIAGAVVAAVATLYVQRVFVRESAKGGIGPAVVGVFSPRIVTPRDFADRFDAEEQALILAHEQVHIRRQDLRLNAIATAISCLFWFNPLIHLANRHMRIDQELACDEAVIIRFPQARNTYARALVKSQLANRPLPLGCYWPSGTQHPFLERIAMLKKDHVGARRRLIGAAALGALCAASGLAAWAAIPAETVYEAAAPAPQVEVAAAPLAETPAAQPPAPAPAQKTAEPYSPASAEVCLTNACSEANAAPPAAAPAVAEVCIAPCRIENVGAARIPVGRAFATYFDGDKPMLVRGRVVEVRMEDGVSGEFVIEHNQGADAGRRFRSMAGDPSRLTPDQRAMYQGLVGAEFVVRGYQAHDRSGEGGGYLMNGQFLNYPDGRPVTPGGRTFTPPPVAP